MLPVTDLPENAPVLVGHMVLEQLDLCLDIRKGLIYNPDHDNEWIEETWQNQNQPSIIFTTILHNGESVETQI